MKYTREILAEAVAQSTTFAGVLRVLKIRQTGGGHNHIKRRITELGLDTSHFTGRATSVRSAQRLTPGQVLAIRAPHRNRPSGARLTAALLEIGMAHVCAVCGQGPMWNGLPLVLHVDHINGDFADCRAVNLRFLCPHCHSQTRNFAGRGKHRTPAAASPRPRDDDKPITTADAARLLGCSRSHFQRLRYQLRQGVQRDPSQRQSSWSSVIRCALTFPEEGPRKIASRLRAAEFGGIRVSHGTVSNVLASAGLNRVEARRAARIPMGKADAGPVDSTGPAGVAEWQTRRP